MAIEVGSTSKTSPEEVLQRARAAGVKVVDVRFVDLPGTWQHFSLPLSAFDEEAFTEGLGFDGSSIRGFQAINESDMLLIPDPDTATVDPVLQVPTLFLLCDLANRPRFKEGYFPVPPTDKLQDLRSEIMLKLIEAGVDVEVQHHEVGTAGQAEIDMRFQTLTKMADQMMVYKYIIKNVCHQHG